MRKKILVLGVLVLAVVVIVASLVMAYWNRAELRRRLLGVHLSEDFEGDLDPRISIASTGAFSVPPGVSVSEINGENTFSFGKSQCEMSCFSQYETTLRVVFPTPTFVRALSFREKEIDSNWGSDGIVLLDGAPWKKGSPGPGSLVFNHFGRSPHNDQLGDQEFRHREFDICREVTIVELRVTDITTTSAVLIDDLFIE